jgi:hypothetical protein
MKWSGIAGVERPGLRSESKHAGPGECSHGFVKIPIALVRNGETFLNEKMDGQRGMADRMPSFDETAVRRGEEAGRDLTPRVHRCGVR